VAQIEGTEGRILIDPLEFHVGAIAIEGADGSEQHAVTPLQGPYFDLPMIDDLVAAVGEDREPACDAATGFTVQAVADAARRQGAGGVKVDGERFSVAPRSRVRIRRGMVRYSACVPVADRERGQWRQQ